IYARGNAQQYLRSGRILTRGRRAALDVIVLLTIMIIVSFIVWGSLEQWLRPEIGIAIATIIVVVPLAKSYIAATQTDPLHRITRILTFVVVVYAFIAIFLLGSRGNDHHTFLLGSITLILVWQLIDTVLASGKFLPR